MGDAASQPANDVEIEGEVCDRCYTDKGIQKPATHFHGGVPLCRECATDTSQSRFEERKFEIFDPEAGFGDPIPQVRHIPVPKEVKPEPVSVPVIVKETPVPPGIVAKGICEKCGIEFEIKPLTSGRFCSRACYQTKKEVVMGEEHLCLCGCGTKLYGAHKVARGHRKNIKGMAKSLSGEVLPSVDEETRTVIRRGREVQVEQTKTTMTVRDHHHHANGDRNSGHGGDQGRVVELSRKVTILIPKYKPKTQVLLTPEIAEAVWSSLTMAQKFDLFDVEDLWRNYDDDMKMMIIDQVLLVDPDVMAREKKKAEANN